MFNFSKFTDIYGYLNFKKFSDYIGYSIYCFSQLIIIQSFVK